MSLKLQDAFLSKIPYIRYAYYYRRFCNQRPGHFYSPVNNIDELSKREDKIWKVNKNLTGIELNEAIQESFIEELGKASKIIPFSSTPNQSDFRYYFNNGTYAHADGLVLFSFLLKLNPKKVIEIGSGFSSALMLDTNDQFLNKKIEFTFIEPNPEINLNKLLRKEDYKNAKILNTFVQDVDINYFKALEENDVLLIDNSHVSKTGSDVNYLMTEILPLLNKGVIIHIHDIFFPFEYPKEWILEKRINWNEIYAVHNFLLFNSSFEIVFFSDFMQQKLKSNSNHELPLFFKDRPGSLWIRKVK
jgi:predicted O-methyltransferase YrrM